MKVTTATRNLNIGSGIVMGVLGFIACGAALWLVYKGTTPTPVVVPAPVADTANCRSLAPLYGFIEQPPPAAKAGQAAPWAPDSIHFIQADQGDPRQQLLNVTAFQTRCAMSLDYFCMGSACIKERGTYMRAVFKAHPPLTASLAAKAP